MEMDRLWTCLLCMLVPGCYGFPGREEADHGPPGPQFDDRSFMIQFIIHKGCDYVSAFVWSHYMQHHLPGPPDHPNYRQFLTSNGKCNWQDTVLRYFAVAHVPHELAHALIDCGPTHSFGAMGDKDLYLVHCNMSHHGDDHTSTIVGRRDLHERREKFARDKILNSNNNPPFTLTNSSQPLANTPDRGVSGLFMNPSYGLLGRNNYNKKDDSPLAKWCASYSRKVNHRFRLAERQFERTSRYWLVDVYRMADKAAAPRSYIHALVGCGQRFALDAFGAPRWLSLAYARMNIH